MTMRTVLAFFLLLSILVALLFFNRLTIAERIVISQLQARGCKNVQFTLKSLSTNHLEVSLLHVDGDDSFPLQSLDIQDLQARFTLQELRKKKIQFLHIKTLQLTPATAANKKESPLDISKLIHLALPAFLPRKITVESLILSGNQFNPFSQKALQLQAEFLPHQQKLTICLPDMPLCIVATRDFSDRLLPKLQLQATTWERQFFSITMQQEENGTLSGSLHSQLTNTTDTISRLFSSSLPKIDGTITVHYLLPASSTQLRDVKLNVQARGLSVSGWHCQSLSGKLFLSLQEFKTIQIKNGSSLDAKEVKRDTLSMEAITVKPLLTLSQATDTSIITLTPDAEISVKNLHTDKATIPRIHIGLAETLHLTKKLGSSMTAAVPFPTIYLDVDAVHIDAITVFPTLATVTVSGNETAVDPQNMRANLKMVKSSFLWQNHQTFLTNIDVDLTKDKGTILMESGFSLAENPGRVHTRIEHNLTKNEGNIHISTNPPLSIDTEQQNIIPFLASGRFPLVIKDGDLETDIWGRWRGGKPLSFKATTLINNGEGSFADILFNGFQLQEKLLLTPENEILASGTISIQKLNAGLLFSDTTLSNHLKWSPHSILPAVTIDSIQTTLFDGILRSSNISINPAQPDLDFELMVDGIHLEKSVLLQKVKGLSVNGILDGAIRVKLSNKQLSIPGGMLESRPPGGQISYIPPGGPGSIPQIPKVAMLALEEFHYDSLIASPRYESDGNLIVTVQTRGKSPKLDSSRPVHLNLTIKQNLLSLLKSLRYTGNLTDGLEKHLQKRFETNN